MIHALKIRAVRATLVTTCILLIPLIAMQFTAEVMWDAADFLIGGILLFGTALLFDYSISRQHTSLRKVIIGGLILTIFLLIWGELAVGIFGSPWAGS